MGRYIYESNIHNAEGYLVAQVQAIKDMGGIRNIVDENDAICAS